MKKRIGKKKRVGFIIDDVVPAISEYLGGRISFRGLFLGETINTSISLMRFKWIADKVNAKANFSLHYELYRPWRKYDVVIFLKSMNKKCYALARKLQRSGVKIIFDCNVDYFTPAAGIFYYEGMSPSDEQRLTAIKMAQICDAVIGDSEHITESASQYNSLVTFIPDNVRDDLIGKRGNEAHRFQEDGRLVLTWSGQACKLFEFLAIKQPLIDYSDRLHLRLVTNSRDALDLWYPPYKEEFLDLLENISHEFVEFTSIDALMEIYRTGSVCVSPRFLNNTYNLGHTEWKILLAMACGSIALCSPQSSYKRVFDLAGGKGVRICHDSSDWGDAFDLLLNDYFDWNAESKAAVDVVKQHYATEVTALQHADFIKAVLEK